MDQVLAHARNFAGAPCDRPQALPVPLTVMSQQVLDELLETFFPNGKHEIVRLNPPLPDTVIREMRDIFLQHLQRDHRDSFTWDDMLMSMYSLVVTHCRITPQIQILGNAKFRSMLCSAFESSVCGLPHDVRACAARDRSLLESAARTIETLCTTQEVELSGKPRDATDDAFVTPHTPAHAVHAALAAVGQPRSAGPAPLLIWDSDTQSLFDRLFEPLFASANPPPSGIISRPLAGQAMSMHESLSAHFGDQALTRDTILHELKLASSGVCVEYLLKPLRCYLERKSQRLCSRIIRFRRPPPPPFPGIPPFPDVDPPVPTIEWPIKFDRSDLPDSVRQTRKWSTDFNEVNFGASFRPFLDASELPDITGSKHGRIAAEHNRCFFIHLGAALNIHPVWLQVTSRFFDFLCFDCIFLCLSAPNISSVYQEDFRRHAHRAILKNQFCQSQGPQPLMDVLKPDQLIDIAILYSYWPDYLRGVKLLFVNCRERHTEGPLIGMEKILPATWTVIKDPGGFHREIVLKLSGNHFTLLQPAVPSLTDPASHLHRLAMEAGFPDPVDISDLIWGPLDGFSPENDDDYQAAVTTVLQWWPDEYFDDEE